tara:strand:- start:1099 stop:1317 length:219 start_codon:yes stop_codon:yes gene_type:complete
MNKVVKIVVMLLVVYLVLDNFDFLKNNVKLPLPCPKKDTTEKYVSTSDPFAKCSPEANSDCEKPKMEHLSRK